MTEPTALVLVCSLKKSPAPSSSEKLGREVLDQLAQHGVKSAGVIRVVDHNVAFGVTDDEGDGDAWPGIRAQLLAADILVLATPIWMGQPASVVKMVLERLDNEVAVTDDEGDGDAWPGIRAQLLAADILVLATPIWMGQPASVVKMVLERLDNEVAVTDDDGRPVLFGKVAIVAVVGNEDGAHHTSAELFQSLNDVGYTIPAQGVTYWVGEAMGSVDYNDLDEVPEKTASTTATAARNAAHLATQLKKANYPTS